MEEWVGFHPLMRRRVEYGSVGDVRGTRVAHEHEKGMPHLVERKSYLFKC